MSDSNLNQNTSEDITEAEAEAKFEAWKNNKQSGLATLKAKLDEAKKAEEKATPHRSRSN